MSAEASVDYRLALAQGVEAAVDREGYRMGVPTELCHRAKEALILRMLSRFPTKETLLSVTAINVFLETSARRQLLREQKNVEKAAPIVLASNLEHHALAPASANPRIQAEERHEYAHLMLKIREGLSELSAQERQVLELRLKGFRNKTIAAILGTTSNTVCANGSQGVRKLRRLYREPA